MELEADYLVIGSGATGMAFVDTLLTETDATIVMLDDRAVPGGHWNETYPFVRLHQSASTYGVNSKDLGRGRVEETGLNAGFEELSSGPEITRYYHELMEETFLPSGRVTFLPLTRYHEDGTIQSTLTGETHTVNVRKKTVFATHITTSIPATHTRNFETAEDVACIPPNDLPLKAGDHDHFCVLGSGKTAMDSIIWLLGHGCTPDRISWVVPREAWFLNRVNFQTIDQKFFDDTVGGQARAVEIYAAAESIEDLEDRMEAANLWQRIDKTRRPTMFHAAIMTEKEVETLRQIKNVIRKGRVQRIEPGKMVMAEGEVEMPADTLYLDCTASAFANYVNFRVPVFQPGEIHLQAIRQFQPCYSAALIAAIEARIPEADKNNYARPAPGIDTVEDVLLVLSAAMENTLAWMSSPEISDWRATCRLDGFNSLISNADMNDPSVAETLMSILGNGETAISNLQRLAADAEAARATA
ncbi:MAG: NAD(P)/FAD-dependent oxidoreductase [Pseudomonadota bacterium]